MPSIGEVVIRDLKDVFNTSASYKVNLYTYNGAEGLTLGELLMAICLYRANTVEASTVSIMDVMSKDTARLNVISQLATDIVNTAFGAKFSASTMITTEAGIQVTVYSYMTSDLGIPAASIPGGASAEWNNDERTTVYSLLKTKMDALNSISQENMIELQSLINKRDQSYNLASNGVKLMLNSGIAVANNI